VLSALLLLAMVRLVPPTLWVSPNAPTRLLLPWLLAYFVFGAMGAYWSRRVGGSVTARVLSGTFPLAMHVVVMLLPVLVTWMSATPKFPEHLDPTYLLRIGLLWVLIPGIALALGTLPFLGKRAAV